MYYRKNDETVMENYSNFSMSSDSGSGDDKKFPLWLLILIIVVVILVVVGFLWFVFKKSSGSRQNFGYRFY